VSNAHHSELVAHPDAHAAAVDALDRGARVVTLTGPPGVGKSWLQRQLAATLPPDISVADDIDNHLDEWRQRIAGGGRWLASARQPLGLPDEVRVALRPVPRGALPALVAAIAPRATELELDVVLAHTGGLPLVLRFALERLEVLSTAELERRLIADPLQVLQGACPAEGPAHHRSWSAAIDWTWGSLTAHEQSVLAQASAFAGPLTLPALEHCAADALGPDLLQAVHRLTVLGWVVSSEGGQLTVPAPVRAFALATVDDASAAIARHADAVLDGRLLDAREATQAFTAAHGRGDPRTPQLALCLDPPLGPLAYLWEPWRAAVAQVADGGGTGTERAAAWRTLGRAWRARHVPDSAWSCIEHAVAIARDAGDRRTEAAALVDRCALLQDAGGDVDVAETLTEAVHLLRAVVDDEGAGAADHGVLGTALTELADSLRGRGDIDGCRDALEQASRAFEVAGDVAGRAGVLQSLGLLAHNLGHLGSASERLEEAAATARHIGDDLGAETTLGFLGRVRQEQGDPEAAREIFLGVGERAASLGDRLMGLACTAQVGVLAHERGDLTEARRRYETLLASIGPAGRIRGYFAAHLAALHVEIGESTAAHALAADARRLLEGAEYGGLGQAVHVLGAAEAIAADREGDARKRVASALEDTQDRLAPVARFYTVRSAVRVIAGLAARLGRHTLADAWRDHLHGRVWPRSLVVAFDGGWFRTPAEADSPTLVNLRARRKLQPVLAELAASRRRAPGTPVDSDQLIAVAWPGERMVERSAAKRLRVAISTLRSLGLGDRVLFEDGGYLLDPAVPFTQG